MANKILVVDNEEDLLELLKYDLGRLGYIVICASTGEEGLDMVSEKNSGSPQNT